MAWPIRGGLRAGGGGTLSEGDFDTVGSIDQGIDDRQELYVPAAPRTWS
jgi:hypothetical protein